MEQNKRKQETSNRLTLENTKALDSQDRIDKVRDSTKKSGEEENDDVTNIDQKFEWLRIDKKMKDLDSLNPLHLKIEDISKLPEDIPITTFESEPTTSTQVTANEMKGNLGPPAKEIHIL